MRCTQINRFSAKFLGLCFGVLGGGSVFAQEEVRALELARGAASSLLQQVRSELTKEMEIGGPLRAIVVCKYSTPEISSAISRKLGGKVSRVSLKTRNPSLGSPDLWEQKVLQDFDRRATKGEKLDAMEWSELVIEPIGRSFRYMKAIPIAQACLACHGPVDSLMPAIRAMLHNEYPHDQGMGYALGQVRGGVTVKLPLP